MMRGGIEEKSTKKRKEVGASWVKKVLSVQNP